jgi:protein-S-isoprenylcysteine O-methyltransferase Ste14
LLVGVILAAFIFDTLLVPLPIPFGEQAVVRGLGMPLLVAGIGLVAWAAMAFRRHATSIRPDRAATSLIETGPYRFSRNPIYLGEVIALAGAALALNRFWLLLAAAVFAALVQSLAILPEEGHLERRFGDEYRAYMGRVRRWI